jgi:hypothetical protein
MLCGQTCPEIGESARMTLATQLCRPGVIPDPYLCHLQSQFAQGFLLAQPARVACDGLNRERWSTTWGRAEPVSHRNPHVPTHLALLALRRISRPDQRGTDARGLTRLRAFNGGHALRPRIRHPWSTPISAWARRAAGPADAGATHRLMFLICLGGSLMSALMRGNRRRQMAIECTRCGGPTMSETVIKPRRSVLGFHETRSQGAYCETCKLSERPNRKRTATRTAQVPS